MSFRIRAATPGDLGALYDLSKLTGGGFTNLPADKRRSRPSSPNRSGFERDGETRTTTFLFVLEKSRQSIRGNAGVRQGGTTYRLRAIPVHVDAKSEALGRIFETDLSWGTDSRDRPSPGACYSTRTSAGGLEGARARRDIVLSSSIASRVAVLAELFEGGPAGNSPFWEQLAGGFRQTHRAANSCGHGTSHRRRCPKRRSCRDAARPRNRVMGRPPDRARPLPQLEARASIRCYIDSSMAEDRHRVDRQD